MDLTVHHRDACIFVCLLLHYPQQLQHGTSLDVNQQSAWMSKMWYIHVMTIYSLAEINRIVAFAGKRMLWRQHGRTEGSVYLGGMPLGNTPRPRPLCSLPSSLLFFYIFSALLPLVSLPPTLGFHQMSSFLLPHPLTMTLQPHDRPQSDRVGQPWTENLWKM